MNIQKTQHSTPMAHYEVLVVGAGPYGLSTAAHLLGQGLKVKTLEVDHVILGTGCRSDITRLPMLHSSLANELDTYMGSPILNTRFESSIPGLYFIGFTAVRSFGPFYRWYRCSSPADNKFGCKIGNTKKIIARSSKPCVSIC